MFPKDWDFSEADKLSEQSLRDIPHTSTLKRTDSKEASGCSSRLLFQTSLRDDLNKVFEGVTPSMWRASSRLPTSPTSLDTHTTVLPAGSKSKKPRMEKSIIESVSMKLLSRKPPIQSVFIGGLHSCHSHKRRS